MTRLRGRKKSDDGLHDGKNWDSNTNLMEMLLASWLEIDAFL